jgi:hypothetical protein
MLLVVLCEQLVMPMVKFAITESLIWRVPNVVNNAVCTHPLTPPVITDTDAA